MTSAGRATSDRVELARRDVVALIRREQAAVAPELEAALCEQQRPGTLRCHDPQDVRLAVDDLEATGRIVRVRSRASHATRETAVFMLPDGDPGRRAVAEHKRDLFARYLSWTEGADSPIRLGAQQVVHASLQVAARSGYQVAAAPPADVTVLAAPRADGTSGRPVLIPLEVRSSRDWLMTHSTGLYPLLIKATRIQVAEPTAPIMPMVVCRRAHPQLLAMGRDLGFLVLESRREFILPSVAETAVAEVRSSLGLTDLTRADTADRLMVSRLEQIVPTMTTPLLSRWRQTTATTIPLHFTALLDEDTAAGRRRVVRTIRSIAVERGLADQRQSW